MPFARVPGHVLTGNDSSGTVENPSLVTLEIGERPFPDAKAYAKQ